LRDTFSFRFPDQDKEIKRGAQLIVRESFGKSKVNKRPGDVTAAGVHGKT